MKSVALTVFPRSVAKRNGVKKLRDAKRIPAVIYGRHHPPQNLEVEVLDFDRLTHHTISENILVDLEVQGDARAKRLALVQDVQHNALSGHVLHVDFHEVAENEKVTITVPLESVGEAVGVKGGGVLEHLLFKLKVRGLPKDLPENLVVDVSHLEIGKAIHIGEITPPPHTEILGDKKIVVISVTAPITEEQEAAATAAATEGPLEPEMIKEKKEEGAEAEAGAEKGAEKAPGKPAAKGAEKAPEKATEKAGDKGAEKKAEKKK